VQTVRVEPVLPAQVEQHLRLRRPLHPPVVRELDVAHHRPVSVAALRRPQVHAHTQLATARAGQRRHDKSCAHAEPGCQTIRAPPTCTFTPTRVAMCPSTAEPGITTRRRSTHRHQGSLPGKPAPDGTRTAPGDAEARGGSPPLHKEAPMSTTAYHRSPQVNRTPPRVQLTIVLHWCSGLGTAWDAAEEPCYVLADDSGQDADRKSGLEACRYRAQRSFGQVGSGRRFEAKCLCCCRLVCV